MLKNKKFGKILFCLFAVSIVVGGCRAPWTQSPKEVLRQMSTAMSTVEYIAFDTMNMEVKGKFANLSNWQDSLAKGEAPTPSTDGVVTYEIKGATETFYLKVQPDFKVNSKMTITLGADTYNLDVDTATIDKTFFLKINQSPNATEMINLSSLIGKWWFTPRYTESALSSFIFFPMPKINPSSEELDKELTAEQTQELEKLVAETTLFIVKDEHVKEKCKNGKKAYYYTVILDEKATKATWTKYNEIVNYQPTYDEMLAFEDMVESLAKFTIDLWIESKNYQICKYSFTGDYFYPEKQQTYNVKGSANVNAETSKKFIPPENAIELKLNDLTGALKIFEWDEIQKSVKNLQNGVVAN